MRAARLASSHARPKTSKERERERGREQEARAAANQDPLCGESTLLSACPTLTKQSAGRAVQIQTGRPAETHARHRPED